MQNVDFSVDNILLKFGGYCLFRQVAGMSMSSIVAGDTSAFFNPFAFKIWKTIYRKKYMIFI